MNYVSMLNKWMFVECLLGGPKEQLPQVTRDRKSRVSPVWAEFGVLLDGPAFALGMLVGLAGPQCS